MATVASVYDVAPHVRTAEQIMGQDESSAPKRPKVRNRLPEKAAAALGKSGYGQHLHGLLREKVYS